MTDWKLETGKYTHRIESLCSVMCAKPTHPTNIPYPPLEETPTHLQLVLHRNVTSYEIGVWERSNETLSSVLCLWKEGFLCEAASISRLLFEIWGASNYLTQSIEKYVSNTEIEKLEKTSNSIFEGVRSEVLMPWGVPASEKPIHVMDTIRKLKVKYPKALQTYDDLCESAHANQPRYFEWWVIGKYGDNWNNKIVQTRGHELLERTIKSLEDCVNGISESTSNGLNLCGKLY